MNPEPTMVTGVAISQPARGAQILAALRATDGAAVAVREDEIKEVRNRLACQGFYIEETSAVAVAALAELGDTLRESAPGAVTSKPTGVSMA